MNKDALLKEKEELTKQYEECRDKTNQVFGALMWVNQRIEELNKEAPNG